MPPATEILRAGYRRAIVPWELKAINPEARTFEGLAATWDLDLGNDVIHRGAFKQTLSDWKRSGRVIPLIDQHNYYSIRSALGKMTEAEEQKSGLWTKWSVIRGEDGDAAMDRLREGVIDSMSIGYEPIKYDFEEDEAKGMIRHLRTLGLREVSLVLFPMQPDALIDLDSVKALAGRDLPPAMRDNLLAIKGEIDRVLSVPAPEQPEPEDNAPAFDLLDRLRLRRLGATL